MGLISGILLSCKNKNYFSLIPIDLSTVFDIVAHQVLLKKYCFTAFQTKLSNDFQVIFQQKKRISGLGKSGTRSRHVSIVT